MPSATVYGVVFGAWKDCVQPVRKLLVGTQEHLDLSTRTSQNTARVWVKGVGYQRFLHIFGTRFYTAKVFNFTDISRYFSPLSTPLIIRTIWEKKEKLLIG